MAELTVFEVTTVPYSFLEAPISLIYIIYYI